MQISIYAFILVVKVCEWQMSIFLYTNKNLPYPQVLYQGQLLDVSKQWAEKATFWSLIIDSQMNTNSTSKRKQLFNHIKGTTWEINNPNTYIMNSNLHARSCNNSFVFHKKLWRGLALCVPSPHRAQSEKQLSLSLLPDPDIFPLSITRQVGNEAGCNLSLIHQAWQATFAWLHLVGCQQHEADSDGTH